jgi:hypothetical protein
MTIAKDESPEIGLIITPDGVKGAIVLGDTLKVRQKSLALLDLLEPDLIEVQRLLNHRIGSLRGNVLKKLRM